MGKNKWLVMLKRANWNVVKFYNKGQDQVGVSNQLLQGANVATLLRFIANGIIGHVLTIGLIYPHATIYHGHNYFSLIKLAILQ
jgi:hypothetical protein